MHKYYEKVIERLLSLNRSTKNALLLLTDYLVLVMSFWISLMVRSNSIYIPTLESQYLIFLAPFIALPIFYFFGLYKSLIRYGDSKFFLLTILSAVTLYTSLWFLIVLSISMLEKPYDFLFINWIVTIFSIGFIRFLAREILASKTSFNKVLIYGAGSAGIELKSALTHNPNIIVIGFIDHNPAIQGRYISGLKVMNPSSIEKIIERNKVREVFIAIPSLSRKEKINLIQSLSKYQVVIKSIPSLSELAQGKVSISDLKKVKTEELLHREVRKPIQELLIKDIQDKNILVTGAGGSIGSELCRQIIKLKPKSLVLFEISEAALYIIDQELKEEESGVKILAMIGNVTRRNRLDFILNNYNIETIYHTAAYKHVPLVEKNTIPGIRCNIFGTLTCIQGSN